MLISKTCAIAIEKAEKHKRKSAKPLYISSLALVKTTRDSVGIRTQDPQLRRLLLYPAELRNHRFKCAKLQQIAE